jgi:hypothetical protein
MIVALAGRRVDAAGAAPARFPLENAPQVRERIRQALIEQKATGLVASAACGADLLALDEAGKLGLRRRIVLPFPREEFRSGSVTDRPGDWGPLYDQIVNAVQARGDLVVLDATGDPDAAYELATTAILDQAQQLAQAMGEGRQQVTAVAVWDLVPRGAGDLTVAFADQARQHGMPVVDISTR